MTKATISPAGHIAIPRAVLERLKLQPGTEVSIDVQGEVLVMKRVDYPDWRTMRGMFRGGWDLTKELEEERAAEVARDNSRINQGRWRVGDDRGQT